MGNQEHRGQGSTQRQNDAVAKRAELTAKIVELEKRIHELKQGTTASKSQQTSIVQDWVGTPVRVFFIGGEQLQGVLKSLDRYTYCIELDNPAVVKKTVVVHKGAVTYICQF